MVMPETPKQKEKVEEVMHEFKEGDLHSGKSKKKVTNPKQAVAIAMSEAGISRNKRRSSGTWAGKSAGGKKASKRSA
jgi:hypothetical protein